MNRTAHHLSGFHLELPHILDAVADPVSGFFHNPDDFICLFEQILPIVWNAQPHGRKFLNIWHAGCSTGEGTYSLGITLFEFASRNAGCNGQILGTDFSGEKLETAQAGIYTEEAVSRLSYEMKRTYLLRSRDRTRPLVRVRPALREIVRFRHLDFLEEFNFRDRMDIIFCRRLLHHFHIPVQQRMLRRICAHLETGGCVFLGHGLAWDDPCLEEFLPGIYFRKE